MRIKLKALREEFMTKVRRLHDNSKILKELNRIKNDLELEYKNY